MHNNLGIKPRDWRDPQPPLLQGFRRLAAPPDASVRAAPPDASVATALCPDLSFYDREYFDLSCFRSYGIKSIMLQLTDSFGLEAARLCQAAQMPIDVGYCFPYFSSGTTQPQQVTTLLAQRCIDYNVPIALFDAELDSTSSPPSVADRQRQTRECIGILRDAGLRTRIYTAPWFWVPNLGNTAEFYEMGIEHHLANYGSNDGTQRPIRQNSGGYAWPYNVAHQYWSLANYCGRVERDMNYVWSDGLPQPQEKEMTREEIEAIVNDILEQRIDDGETKNSGLVAGSTFVDMVQQAIGMKDSTFTIDGAPDPRTGPQGSIRKWLNQGGPTVKDVIDELLRKLTNA